jgi:hypothetical protein
MTFKTAAERRAAWAKRGTIRQDFGRVKGWTTPISPASHGSLAKSLLRRRLPGWKKEDHLAQAGRFKQAAEKLDAAWEKKWETAYQAKYGRPPKAGDYRVSGVGDDGLAATDKNLLRGLARARSRAEYLASAHRAAGYHLRKPRLHGGQS